MAQLDDQAAVVADEALDSAAATETDEAREDQQEEAGDDTLQDLYPDETGRAEEADEETGEAEEGEEEGGDQADRPEPIAAPASWKAEEKETFAKLPREIQETLARRESERERFVQSKAQEAKQARTEVEREALGYIQQLHTQAAAQLQHFEQQLAVPPPNPDLLVEDPELYVQQEKAYRYYAAQRAEAQQLSQQAAQRAQQAQQQIADLESQRTGAVLAEKFPEYLDPENGPKLREELGSIAIELGYPAEQLANVDATDILAMKKAREWRAKAAKWDAIQSRKMEGVRAAKKLPRIAKPGAATAGARAPANDALKLLYPND
jgi:hypothetical protein